MNAEEKIFGLMAQAEDMQVSAMGLIERAEQGNEKLLEMARETFKNVERAADKAKEKIINRGQFWTIMGVSIVFLVSLVVSVMAVVGSRWAIKTLNAELESEITEKQGRIAELKETESQLDGKTWGLLLQKYKDGTRVIVLKKGETVANMTKTDKGEVAIILK